MGEELEFFKQFLEEGEFEEYLSILNDGEYDDIDLAFLYNLINEFLKGMKKDNIRESLYLGINVLIYNIKKAIRNSSEEELEDLISLNLYSNRIERKCLTILKKSLKSNLELDNFVKILICSYSLETIQVSIYNDCSNFFKRDEYLDKGINLLLPDPVNLTDSRENIDKVYEYVKKLENK